MERFLFITSTVFSIKGRGLVLDSGIRHSLLPHMKPGDTIELRRPDGSALRAPLKGADVPRRSQTPVEEWRWGIMLGPEVTVADVPAGTEVWLCQTDGDSDSPFAEL